MTKQHKRIDINQLSIFEIIQEITASSAPVPGSYDIDKSFREAISRALKACPLSRYQVAGRMSELVGQDITKSMLDSWTAESKEQHRFPAIYLPSFCEATGQTEILTMLGQSAKVFVMAGPDALRAEIRRDEEMIRDIQKRKAKKTVLLNTMENGGQD
ncbi:MAG: hypothetical protein WC450_10465 [Candidatus Omnitrophota bacterium]|jgi:predicted transcriptional regulator